MGTCVAAYKILSEANRIMTEKKKILDMPGILSDIAGFSVMLELDQKQREEYKVLLQEFVMKKFGLTDPAMLEETLIRVLEEDRLNGLEEFFVEGAVKEFLTSGRVPIKRTTQFLPWLTPEVILYLEYYMIPYQNCKSILEFGGGNSSIWLAKRADFVVTVESSPVWAEAIQRWAREEKLTNIVVVDDLRKVPPMRYDLIMIDDDGYEQCVKEAMWAAGTGCAYISVDNVKNFADEKGNKGEGSGQYAHRWLLDNGFETVSLFTDTAFYARKR